MACVARLHANLPGDKMHFHNSKDRENLTPQDALEVLVAGNQRFVNNFSARRDLLAMLQESRNVQDPFAAVLSCSDSRVPIELVFDQGLGDVFSVRLAGNIASLKAIASIEYACQYLGTRLIVVLGHTRCGGVTGACDGLEAHNLSAIFSDIEPAVAMETTTTENRTSSNLQFLNNVIHLNVEYQMREILKHSELIRGLLAEKKIGLVGGIFDLDTGMVNFYEEDRIFSADSQFSGIQKHVST